MKTCYSLAERAAAELGFASSEEFLESLSDVIDESFYSELMKDEF